MKIYSVNLDHETIFLTLPERSIWHRAQAHQKNDSAKDGDENISSCEYSVNIL